VHVATTPFPGDVERSGLYTAGFLNALSSAGFGDVERFK
jgi:hypothetical protein